MNLSQNAFLFENAFLFFDAASVWECWPEGSYSTL